MSGPKAANAYEVVIIGAGPVGTPPRPGQVSIARLWHAVPCFPSISEVWLRLLEGYLTSRDR